MDVAGTSQIPKRFSKILEACKPYYETSRPGDLEHALETAKDILTYKGKLPLDLDVFIPVALMHDIGHAAILGEHFMYITGPKKLANGKLVHMLTGAKIASDILKQIGYDKKKSEEIVEIISIHDADALEGIDQKEFYNSNNKKIFHDFDRLDRFTELRLQKIKKLYSPKDLIPILQESLDGFFFAELRKIAEERMKNLALS